MRSSSEFTLTPLVGRGEKLRRGNSDNKSPEALTAQEYLSRYEADRRSVFVGNLPVGTTITDVQDLFGEYGPIIEIKITETPSKYESQSPALSCFSAN